MNIVILDRMALGEDIDMSVFEKLGTVTIYERTAPDEGKGCSCCKKRNR